MGDLKKDPNRFAESQFTGPSLDHCSPWTIRRWIILFAVFNCLAISLVTAYILYSFWLFEKSIDQPFVGKKVIRESESGLYAVYLQTSNESSLLYHAPRLRSKFQKTTAPGQAISDTEQCQLLNVNKFDCHPMDPVNKELCEARGCCWVPATRSKRGMPPLNTPYCFYPKDFTSYRVVKTEEGHNSVTIQLTRAADSGYPMDIDNVEVQVIGLDNERVRIRFVDPKEERFEVPMPFFNLSRSGTLDAPLYKIKVNEDGFLQIIRSSTGVVIFNADLKTMIYSDQFIQLNVFVPSNYLYGLGEHKDTFRKELADGWRRYTMFARDIGPTENVNLYGSFPFYMMIEDSEASMNAHGVFLLNSNGMDVLTQGSPAVTWRTIGGILDFFIFMGPTPAEVTRQNINLVGRPILQPYWSFGFHLCRYGYDSLAKTKETLDRNLAVGIPVEAQWNDIDYMDRYNDFTVDEVHFAGLKEFVADLHSRHMYYTIILDPGVSAAEKPGTYPPYDEGVTDDIFVKTDSGEIFVGKVWNLESTAFPDFTHPRIVDYWKKQFLHLREKISFDGIWIDMNEPSNFLSGTKEGCPDERHENAPYLPGGGPLNSHTLCMTAKQHLGIHYNVHNLYGLYENVATYKAAVDILGTRPFILSRSTFPSQSNFGAHWSGDIRSSWDHMKYSISNMFEFNVYGMPMIGSDICGFNGNTEPELCMRWQSLGAFYPFSRNHNDRNGIEQDPAIMGEDVIKSTLYALDARYRLLPYLYTLFYKAHLLGDTVVRPLFFEWPLDLNTYPIEEAFLWGSALYIVPVLEAGTLEVKAYFPLAAWYKFDDSTLAFNSSGQFEQLTIARDRIGLFVRGGSILPVYPASANTTYDLRKQKYHFMVYLDSAGQAHGEIYHDDGQSLSPDQSGQYIHGELKANKTGIVCSYIHLSDVEGYSIGGFTIAGITTEPKTIHLNGQPISGQVFNPSASTLKITLPDNFYPLQSFSLDFVY